MLKMRTENGEGAKLDKNEIRWRVIKQNKTPWKCTKTARMQSSIYMGNRTNNKFLLKTTCKK